MAKITECKHYVLYVHLNFKERDYPGIVSEYFNNAEDMLKRIDEITKEKSKQGISFIRHIDYDYIYFL